MTNKSDTHLLAKVGQYALITNSKNKLLLLRRSRSKCWSLPGGKLEKDDKDWRQVLCREVREETGCSISSCTPFDINIIDDPWQTKYCVFFTCYFIGDDIVKISPEHDKYLWVNKEDIKDIVIDHEPLVREVIEFFFISTKQHPVST